MTHLEQVPLKTDIYKTIMLKQIKEPENETNCCPKTNIKIYIVTGFWSVI